MCGIVGYIGKEEAKTILLKGLERLEYRGYDSAGIALQAPNQVHIIKTKGRIDDLRKKVQASNATIGIGHTRWATHGEPNDENAHPHQSTTGRFTLVHNGVIENDSTIKREYFSELPFQSETDSEVIVQLVDRFVQEGFTPLEAFRKSLQTLHGSYAIALLDSEDYGTIYAAKNKSPLLVGIGKDFHVVASDAIALLSYTKTFVELKDKEIVILQKDSYSIETLAGEKVLRNSFIAEIDAEDLERGTYPHYMLKEIEEQPLVIRKISEKYIDTHGEIVISEDILNRIKESDRVYIIACGTSYHAGTVAKLYFEKLASIPVEVHVASEFGYNVPLLPKKPYFIFISQSGETADSRMVLVEVKRRGYPSLTITNVQGSTLSREADATLLLHAGPEIAVASTKAYTAQVAVLLLLAAALQGKKETDWKRELAIASSAMEGLCQTRESFQAIANEFLATTRNAFYIGRGFDYLLALEAALKLKEISYIQTEGFPGGELKHGTIALIEKGTPVFAITTQEHVNHPTRSNVKEVAARGAKTCVISMEGLEEETDRFVLPRVHPLLTILIGALPIQYIAYYAALQRDCDVDKPRNLAKSVTVE